MHGQDCAGDINHDLLATNPGYLTYITMIDECLREIGCSSVTGYRIVHGGMDGRSSASEAKVRSRSASALIQEVSESLC